LIPGTYAYFTLGDSRYIKNGNRLLEQYACRRCHVINGRGNSLAVNLDNAVANKTPLELAESIRRPVDAMPRFGLNEERISYLVNSILAGSQGRHRKENGPVAVHFSNAGSIDRDVFTIKCGSCHRLISQRRGVLGKGNIGPNLSGLITPSYPETFRNNKAWTAQSLKTWMNNPREIRPWSNMRPVRLREDEIKELMSILQVMPGPGI
jgi:cytochrome c2